MEDLGPGSMEQEQAEWQEHSRKAVFSSLVLTRESCGDIIGPDSGVGWKLAWGLPVAPRPAVDVATAPAMIPASYSTPALQRPGAGESQRPVGIQMQAAAAPCFGPSYGCLFGCPAQPVIDLRSVPCGLRPTRGPAGRRGG